MPWEIFIFKNNAENEVERPVTDLFLFFEETLYKQKQVLNTLILIYFGKQTFKEFRLLIKRYVQFWFFIKGSGTSFLTYPTLWTVFKEKYNSFHILLTD